MNQPRRTLLILVTSGYATLATMVVLIIFFDPLNVFGLGASNKLKETPGFSNIIKTFNLTFPEGSSHELIFIGGSNGRTLSADNFSKKFNSKNPTIVVYTSPGYFNWKHLFNRVVKSKTKRVVIFLGHSISNHFYEQPEMIDTDMNRIKRSTYLYEGTLNGALFYLFKSNVFELIPRLITKHEVWHDSWVPLEDQFKQFRTRELRSCNSFRCKNSRVPEELNFLKKFHPNQVDKHLKSYRFPPSFEEKNHMLKLISDFVSELAKKGTQVDIAFVPTSLAFWYSPLIHKKLFRIDLNEKNIVNKLFNQNYPIKDGNQFSLAEEGYEKLYRFHSAKKYLVNKFKAKDEIRFYSFSHLFGIVGYPLENYPFDSHHFSFVVNDYIIDSISKGQHRLTSENILDLEKISLDNAANFIPMVKGEKSKPAPLLPELKRRYQSVRK